MTLLCRQVVPDGTTVADAVMAAARSGWPLVLALHEPGLLDEQGEVVGSTVGYLNVRFSTDQVMRIMEQLCRKD